MHKVKLGVFTIMNEIILNCRPYEKGKNEKYIIEVMNNIDEVLLYKVLLGSNGVWDCLSDFSEKHEFIWAPENEGTYNIMVQARRKNCKSVFEFIEKIEFSVGKEEKKLINGVFLDNNTYDVGNKLQLNVDSSKLSLMYRYWIKRKNGWQIIKEYTSNNTLEYTLTEPGNKQILVECKKIDSQNKYDDFEIVNFNVREIHRTVITDFKCLSYDMTAGKELSFEVEVDNSSNSMSLFKFVKIDCDGNVFVLQDFSSKKLFNYIEKNSGEFKLLCILRNMYSNKEYDDKAILKYTVKPYEDVSIKKFTTDIISPQLCGSEITLKAVVTGGKDLRYRFIVEKLEIADAENKRAKDEAAASVLCEKEVNVEQKACEDKNGCIEFCIHNNERYELNKDNIVLDTGDIDDDCYMWKSEKGGKYNLYLITKDESSTIYEDIRKLEFIVDEISLEPVKINQVNIEPAVTRLLKNQEILVEVNASGGSELKYSFIHLKDDEKIDEIIYSNNNWVNFKSEILGRNYLEIRVKDKYSKKEYDCHEIIPIDVYDYIPAKIDYILKDIKERYIVGEKINFEVICPNTKTVQYKYKLKINYRDVEEIEYGSDSVFQFIPKCSGRYNFIFYCKNIKSSEGYDDLKEIIIDVNDSMPIINTSLMVDKTEIACGEDVTLSVTSQGGAEVLYEFYIMEKGEWNLIQPFSRKDYYTFIPFYTGEYNVLVLAKSAYYKGAYEDFTTIKLNVKNQ